MTNLHSRHPLRGTIHAPVVTMDHAEAARLHQQQSDAFWNSGFGMTIAVVGFLALSFGLPMLVVGATLGATAAWWTPVVMIVVAVLCTCGSWGKDDS